MCLLLGRECLSRLRILINSLTSRHRLVWNNCFPFKSETTKSLLCRFPAHVLYSLKLSVTAQIQMSKEMMTVINEVASRLCLLKLLLIFSRFDGVILVRFLPWFIPLKLVSAITVTAFEEIPFSCMLSSCLLHKFGYESLSAASTFNSIGVD